MNKFNLAIKILAVCIIIFIGVVIVYVLFFKTNLVKTNVLPEAKNVSDNNHIFQKCNFEILNVKVNKLSSKQNESYFEIKGFLRGGSNDFLNSVVAKVYTDDDKKILVASGQQDLNIAVSIGSAIPFAFNVYPNLNDDIIKNILKTNIAFKVDAFPLFSNCR